MNKIEKLLKELCPNGVEFKALGEVCELKRGATITQKQIIEGKIPVIAGGQKPAYFHNQANRPKNVITVAGSGAYAGFVSFWEIPIFLSDAFSVIPSNKNLHIKFVYYFLKNLQNKIYKLKSGGGIPHIYPKTIQDFQIPIPPLEVQEEIVKILDTFTELERELERELESRIKQYEYYRNKLLSLEYLESSGGYELKTLGEITIIKTGNKPKYISDTILEFEYINAGTTKSGYVSESNFPANTITTPSRGQGGIGFVGFQSKDFWLGSLCYGIRTKNINELLPKYLYYYLQKNNDLLLEIKNFGGVPSVNLSDLQNINVYIPPLEVQEEIVSILDQFHALTTNLTSGIPAELEARKKQYEYYRNKLLTFKEAR